MIEFNEAGEFISPGKSRLNRDEEMTHEVRLMAGEIRRLRELNKRAQAIITEAIMHGMPITEEVAAVRNEIV